MTHVITQPCCGDASCVPVCPVDCIHPAPGEAGFMSADLLYIDPGRCVDCGLCVKACPVDAIARDDNLTDQTLPFKELNAAYYESTRHAEPSPAARRPPPRPDPNIPAPRVAVVGSGPAAMFAAAELQTRSRAHVDMFERLPALGGLIRYGVAPDHPHTKQAADLLDRVLTAPGFRSFLGVDVGVTIGHAELARHYHAVIYATGVGDGRRLSIPGEDLTGCYTAAEIVGWYNGHPEHALADLDLSTERAVIIGNGNVALDVARILLSDPARLRDTDISERALNSLEHSSIREVVIIGRRGPSDFAGTAAELIGLVTSPDFTVRADLDVGTEQQGQHSPDSLHEFKTALLTADRDKPSVGRGARFAFRRRPTEIVGDTAVSGVRLTAAEDGEPAGETVVSCGLVIEAIGFCGSPIDDLPFEETTGTIRHVDGRVEKPGGAGPSGVYVAGWIKRGSSGGIGQNKRCARETVDALIADYEAGLLAEPAGDDIATRL